VLSSLEAKGFIEVVLGTPRLFRAVEPKKAITRRLRQIEDDYMDLEHRIRDVLQNLQFEYSQKYNAAQGIITDIIFENEKFETTIREHLLKAEDEVIVSSSDLISGPSLDETIKDLALKGVSVKVLSSNNRVANKLPNIPFKGFLSPGVNSRNVESNPLKFVVVDNKNVSLLIECGEQKLFIDIQSASLCKALRESIKHVSGQGR
jgi:sugar-specific transcriptional regulator TrmB